MLIRDLNLNDVKCFPKDSRIDLAAGKTSPHKWIVVYGENGLGKSTLLRALALALLGQPALNMLSPTAKGWVREDKHIGAVSVRVFKGPEDKARGGARQRPIYVTWGLVGATPWHDGRNIHPAQSIFMAERYEKRVARTFGHAVTKQLDNDARLFNEYIATDEPRRGWLICGYGPHRRLSGASSELTDRIPSEGRAARLVTLFYEGAALISAELWLRQLHHHASLEKGGAAERRLSMIRNIVNSGLLPGDVELTDITPEGVHFKTPFSPRVPFDGLSDGYRTVLAMALDVLRHVDYCFDIESVIEEQDGRTIVTAEGVVLIDEIDAHLHPSWQKAIGKWLHERFPNIQFIVATHSPLIATRVSETEGLIVRLVRKGDAVEVVTEEGTIGLTADQKLTGPDFGLDSPRDVLADDMARRIEELRRRARRKKASPEELKELQHLSQEYERIAPATPTYEGVAQWREETTKIQQTNASAAKKGRKRR